MKISGREMSGRWVSSSGFSLVEVVLTIGIVAITFVGLLGLLGLGVVNDQASSEQTVANNIASSIVSDLRSTPASSSSGASARYGMTLPTTTGSVSAPLSGSTPVVLYFDNTATFIPPANPGAPPSIAAFAANIYMARVLTVQGPAPQSNDMVRVVVYWPAKATTVPAGSFEVTSQFIVH